MNEELIKGYIRSIHIAFDAIIDIVWETEKDLDNYSNKNELRISMAHYMADTFEKAMREKSDAE